MNVITTCACGGSAGVPGKNIRSLCDKPSGGWTIWQASTSKVSDEVFVSTYSEEIAKVGRSFGAQVPFLRSAELATSTAGKPPVTQRQVDWVETRTAR